MLQTYKSSLAPEITCFCFLRKRNAPNTQIKFGATENMCFFSKEECSKHTMQVWRMRKHVSSFSRKRNASNIQSSLAREKTFHLLLNKEMLQTCKLSLRKRKHIFSHAKLDLHVCNIVVYKYKTCFLMCQT